MGSSGGFDSHTPSPLTYPVMRPRAHDCRVPFPTILVLFLIAVAFGSAPSAAQIPLPVPPPSEPGDTIPVEPFRFRPPISPAGAMVRSLVLPGWGQSVLERRVTGAVFVVWEGITLGMTLKSIHQLSHLRRVNDEDAEIIDAKKQEIQDWAVLLVFNHLFAAAEAFVAANLWDFPEEVSMRQLPNGQLGLTLRVMLP